MPGSFRDYLVKVSVRRVGRPFGHVNLYYSPKKDRFSLKTHELREKAVIPDLEACWDRFSSPGGAVAAQSHAGSGYQIYVDGSHLDGAIGYGVVVLKDGHPVAELSGPVEEEGDSLVHGILIGDVHPDHLRRGGAIRRSGVLPAAGSE